jgi:hypothetical protein
MSRTEACLILLPARLCGRRAEIRLEAAPSAGMRHMTPGPRTLHRRRQSRHTDRIPLSFRALGYLATLHRDPPVPVEQVARALERAGSPLRPSWLDFHERYAGYREPLGRETAVLGIVHAESYWLPPGEASIEIQGDGRASVSCAEVHGSFDYRLFDDGSFRSYGGGGPCASFEVKIEQNAAFVEARSDGRRWGWISELGRVDGGTLEALRTSMGAKRIAEASDRFATVWRAPDAIWLERGGAVHLWAADEARGRIVAFLSSVAKDRR